MRSQPRVVATMSNQTQNGEETATALWWSDLLGAGVSCLARAADNCKRGYDIGTQDGAINVSTAVCEYSGLRHSASATGVIRVEKPQSPQPSASTADEDTS